MAAPKHDSEKILYCVPLVKADTRTQHACELIPVLLRTTPLPKEIDNMVYLQTLNLQHTFFHPDCLDVYVQDLECVL